MDGVFLISDGDIQILDGVTLILTAISDGILHTTDLVGIPHITDGAVMDITIHITALTTEYVLAATIAETTILRDPETIATVLIPETHNMTVEADVVLTSVILILPLYFQEVVAIHHARMILQTIQEPKEPHLHVLTHPTLTAEKAAHQAALTALAITTPTLDLALAIQMEEVMEEEILEALVAVEEGDKIILLT